MWPHECSVFHRTGGGEILFTTILGKCEFREMPKGRDSTFLFDANRLYLYETDKYKNLKNEIIKRRIDFLLIRNDKYDAWNLSARTVPFSSAKFMLFHSSYTNFTALPPPPYIWRSRQLPSLPSACLHRPSMLEEDRTEYPWHWFCG